MNKTASKVLRGYDAKIADYRKETIDLSKQLKDLTEAKATTKGIGGVFEKPKLDK